jgi:hypothetical protein
VDGVVLEYGEDAGVVVLVEYGPVVYPPVAAPVVGAPPTRYPFAAAAVPPDGIDPIAMEPKPVLIPG